MIRPESSHFVAFLLPTMKPSPCDLWRAPAAGYRHAQPFMIPDFPASLNCNLGCSPYSKQAGRECVISTRASLNEANVYQS